LASEIGVTTDSISRWKTGKHKPSKKNTVKLLSYLGLPATLDLSDELVFLSHKYTGEFDTKRWLKRRIDELEGKELNRLLSGLMKILRHP
jgi:transcriptional regulator with XRE-family HTH domain